MNCYGLVVCGGNSRRMGRDKAMLNYHGQPQAYHLYNMLKHLCAGVFLSCSTSQANNFSPQYNLLPDEYAGAGPMAALVTAFEKYPGKNFLVTGCDYPFLMQQDMADLLTAACSITSAITFYNMSQQVYEPLLGYYPHTCYLPMKNLFIQGHGSLQYYLQQSGAAKFCPAQTNCLQSIDTPEAFAAATNQLQYLSKKES